jgi:hypothetical protein
MADQGVRNVVLNDEETAIVLGIAKLNGYGTRGFSLALRQIIREWDYMRRVVKIENLPHPEGAQVVPLITVKREADNG